MWCCSCCHVWALCVCVAGGWVGGQGRVRGGECGGPGEDLRQPAHLFVSAHEMLPLGPHNRLARTRRPRTSTPFPTAVSSTWARGA
jgi:hypothetical protein